MEHPKTLQIRDTKSILAYLFQLALLFGLYFISAKEGLKLGAVSGLATLVWPPTGISLAALLIFGFRLWPGITLGAFFVNWSIGAPILASLGIAAGNTLEALVGAYFLKKSGFNPSLGRLVDVFALLLRAALLSTLISATFGVASLLACGVVTPQTYIPTWQAWWLGDVMGDLLVAPFLLVWSGRIRFKINFFKIIKTNFLALLAIVSALMIFAEWPEWISWRIPQIQRAYFIFPFLMLIALHLGQRGAVTANFVVAMIAICGTSSGSGPFWTGSLSESLFNLQLFLSILTISNLVLAASTAERRKEREALKRNNIQLDAILNTAPDCIITIDHEGTIIEFNPAAERTFGYLRSEAVGKEMAELIIPTRLQEAHRQGMQHYLATGQGQVLGHRIEMPALRADGTEFPAELSILPLQINEMPLFTGFIQDITKRKAAETEKKRVENSQKFLIEATKILTESIDYKTTLRHVVESAVPQLGDWCILQIYGEDGNVQTVEFSCSIPEKAPLLEKGVTRYLSGRQGTTIVDRVAIEKKSRLIKNFSEKIYRQFSKDEEQIALVKSLGIQSLIACPLFVHEKVFGTISIASANPMRIYDRLELDLFEELARRSAIAIENARLYHEAQEAIFSRDEFLSIASHELKTPFTALSLQIQVFNRHLKKESENPTPEPIRIPQKIATLMVSCEEQSKKLAKLLDELLDLTRIRLGQLQLIKENIDLASLAMEVIERFKPEALLKGIPIVIQANSPSIGFWDRLRVEQIISNLLSNAIKYGEGKPISVIVKNDELNHKARLEVRDQGMGISPEMREKIFERFERAGATGQKISGLGLGLYICRQIVKAHGGSLCVESEPKKGSTFSVELPLCF